MGKTFNIRAVYCEVSFVLRILEKTEQVKKKNNLQQSPQTQIHFL